MENYHKNNSTYNRSSSVPFLTKTYKQFINKIIENTLNEICQDLAFLLLHTFTLNHMKIVRVQVCYSYATSRLYGNKVYMCENIRIHPNYFYLSSRLLVYSRMCMAVGKKGKILVKHNNTHP